MNIQPNNKRLLVLLAVGIISIVFIFLFWGYLHSGRIIITTSDPNDLVTLSDLGNDSKQGNPKTFSGRGKLDANVKTGKYQARVEGSSGATSQAITLKTHKTLRYDLIPLGPSGVEPVLFQDAQDISINNNHLLYLNGDSGGVNEINGQNNISTLTNGLHFRLLKWANDFFGVGKDEAGNLYSINDGGATRLNMPFSLEDEAAGFDVSPDKQVYVSHNSIIYNLGQNGNLRKIYTTKYPDPVLSAGVGGLAIADGAQNQGLSKQVTLIVLSSSGKISKLNTTATTLNWSPSGKYLMVGDTSGTSRIFTNSLKPVVIQPNISPINYAVWSDDNTVFYSSNDQLWKYDLNRQRSDLIANTPFASPISELALSSDHSYIYLITLDSQGNSAVRRVGLKNQAVPEFVYQLQSLLPLNFGNCNLSLLNFTKPTVVVQAPAAQAQQCQQQAKTELQSRGFDLKSLQISAL